MSEYYKSNIKNGIPHIPKSAVRMLWHHAYWDGPISGACVFDDERLWFSCYDENHGDEKKWYRKFVLLRLSDEQWKEIDLRHARFQDYVGTHTDYDENGKRLFGDLKPRVEPNHAKFYDWAKENPFENFEGEQVATYQTPCDIEGEDEDEE